MLFQNKINLGFCASGWFYYRNEKNLSIILWLIKLPDHLLPDITAFTDVYRIMKRCSNIM
jgi:hypothetical protein